MSELAPVIDRRKELPELERGREVPLWSRLLLDRVQPHHVLLLLRDAFRVSVENITLMSIPVLTPVEPVDNRTGARDRPRRADRWSLV